MKDFTLSANSIGIVFASLVLHEISPLSENLQFINKVLKEEEKAKHSHPGIASAKMEKKLIKAGFSISKKFHPTESIYVIIAQKQK
ncbi:hypothetical protein [Carnobacterium jeotgali]